MKTFDRSGVPTGLFSIIRHFLAGKRIWATLVAAVAAIVLLMPVSVSAKRVEPEKAQKLAQRFAETRQRQHGRPGRADVRLKHAAKRQGGYGQGGGLRRGAAWQGTADSVSYYVFNINEAQNGGFVIVAADDAVKPVLGYSDNGKYDENDLPPNFAYFIGFLQSQIEWAQERGEEQSTEMGEEWERYLNGDVPMMAVVKGPLIKTQWDQDTPYWNMCPMSGDTRTYTGCVATAMAQIMNFHKTPAQDASLVNSEAYTTKTLKLAMPSEPLGRFEWGNMPTPKATQTGTSTQNDAVAKLMYHAGLSVKMDYTTSGSGANSGDVAMALTTYFGYNKSVQMKRRNFYDDRAWEEMLKTELNANRPMYYSGSDGSSGHAFVCDGYSSDGKFHFNWGWGGYYDGDFVTSVLNPGKGGAGSGNGVYNNEQAIIINITPGTGGTLPPYEMALREKFTVSNNSVTLSDPFNVTFGIMNAGWRAIPGPIYFAAALINSSNGKIVEIANYTYWGGSGTFLGSGSGWWTSPTSSPLTINNCQIKTAPSGAYKLKIAVSFDGGTNYEPIDLSYTSGVPTSIDFTVRPKTWDCGAIPNTVTATLDGGKLTISGTGAMANYTDNVNGIAPWYKYRNDITSVVVENGVTKIGNYAFMYMEHALTSATIANSVTSIGDYAFYGCTRLTSISCLANAPPTVSIGAFSGMTLSNICLKVPYNPTSSVTAYSSWSGFDCINTAANTVSPTDYPAVTFDSKGGSVAPPPQTVIRGGKLLRPADPVHPAGHDFGGWYNNAAYSGSAWNFATDAVTASATLYAKWLLRGVEKPTVTAVNLVYDGTEKSAGIAENAAYTVTGATATDAGDYTATVALKDPATIRWIDGGVEDLRLRWSIAKADPTVNWPAGLTAVYGQKLSDISLPPNNDGGTLGSFSWTEADPSVISVGDAGARSHSLKFTPASTVNYNTVSQNVSVTVSPKQLTADMLSVQGAPFTYTASAHTPSVTVTDGATLVLNTDYENEVYVNNTNAGTATVSVTGKGNYTGTVSEDFTIDPAPLTLTADNKSILVDWSEPVYTYTVSGLVGDDVAASVITTPPTFGLSSSFSSATPMTFTIIITDGAANSNYDITNYVNGTLTVAYEYRVDDDITFVPGSKIYTGVELECNAATITGLSGGSWTYNYTAVDGYLGANDKPEGVGTYAVTATYRDDLNVGEKTGMFTITPVTIAITGFNITKQYDESTDVIDFGALSFIGFVNGEAADVDVEGVTAAYSGANVGTGKAVTFTGVFGMTGGTANPANYIVAQPTGVTGVITKAAGTFVTPGSLSVVYSTGLTLADVSLSADYVWSVPTTTALSAGDDQSFAAVYTDPSGNYTSETGSITVNVAKGSGLRADPVNLTILETNTTLNTFDLSTITLNKTDYGYGTLVYSLGEEHDSGPEGKILNHTPILEEGKLLKYTGAGRESGTATLVVNIESQNYDDITVTITFTATLSKIGVIIGGLTAQNSVYDGTAKSGFTGNATSGAYTGALEFVYTGGDIIGTTTTQPVNAGSYTLTVSVPESNPSYTGSESYAFGIAKRPLTLTADNKTVLSGGALPALTYTVSNLPAGKTKADAIKTDPTLACPTFDNSAVGSYQITITGGTATDNYGITIAGGMVTVKASFVSYTITFNPNGGAVSPTSATTSIVDGKLASLPTPTKTGYVFSGWYTASTGGTEVTLSTLFGANAIVYARWTLATYVITFDANGGTVSVASGTTGAGWKLASLPTPAARPGYTFGGWYMDDTKVSTSTVFDSDVTICVRWTPVSYAISYNLAGGSVSGNPTSYTIETAGFTLNNPTKAAYEFDGWTGSNGKVKETSVTVDFGSAGGSRNYTANWSRVVYTVTFGSADTNGTLTATVDGGSIATGASVAQGKNVVFTAVPIGGYEVSDWTVNGAVVAGNTNNKYTLTNVSAAATVSVSFVKSISVASHDRIVPTVKPDREIAVIAPVNPLITEFSVGRNPVGRSSGKVSFFRNGSRVAYATLSIYDASGSVVRKIRIIDDAVGSQTRRKVSTWDLRDAKGRLVSEGTYLVRGAVKTKDGKSEKVSLVVGVR